MKLERGDIVGRLLNDSEGVKTAFLDFVYPGGHHIYHTGVVLSAEGADVRVIHFHGADKKDAIVRECSLAEFLGCERYVDVLFGDLNVDRERTAQVAEYYLAGHYPGEYNVVDFNCQTFCLNCVYANTHRPHKIQSRQVKTTVVLFMTQLYALLKNAETYLKYRAVIEMYLRKN